MSLFVLNSKNSVDLSGYVPYVGATSPLDLGSFTITTGGLNVGAGVSIGETGGYLSVSPGVITGQLIAATLSNEFNQAIIDLNSFAYYDGGLTVAINMNSRQLVDGTGSTVSIDWSSRILVNSLGINSLSWENRSLFDASTNVVVDWGLQVLGSGGVTSIDWANREMYDSGNFQSIGYEARTTYDSNGVASMDYSNRILTRTTGVQSMDWQNGILRDASSITSIHYGNRQLAATTGQFFIDWATVQQVKVIGSMMLGGAFEAPVAKLHIDSGNAAASSIKLTAGTTTGKLTTDGFDIGITSTGIGEIRQRENLNLEIYQNNAIRMQFLTNGAVDCSGGTQYRFAVGSASVPSITFAAGVTDGFYRSGTNQISTAINGAERMRIDSAGKATIWQGTALRGAMATHYTQINSVGNVGVGEDTLHTTTTPSGSFTGNGDSFDVVMSGTFAANANNKRIRLKFGAITLFDTTALAFNGGDWEIRARIFRTTTTTGKSIVTWTCSNATLTSSTDYQSWAFNFLTTNVLQLTGEATADNDIVQELTNVFWIPVS